MESVCISQRYFSLFRHAFYSLIQYGRGDAAKRLGGVSFEFKSSPWRQYSDEELQERAGNKSLIGRIVYFQTCATLVWFELIDMVCVTSLYTIMFTLTPCLAFFSSKRSKRHSGNNAGGRFMYSSGLSLWFGVSPICDSQILLLGWAYHQSKIQIVSFAESLYAMRMTLRCIQASTHINSESAHMKSCPSTWMAMRSAQMRALRHLHACFIVSI